jgi:hypothetical protein
MVSPKMPVGTGVHEVPLLDGQVAVRPLEVLHRLAVATRPRYDDDVLDAYAHWALIRYLGAFACSDGGLTLSDGGEAIRHNQRRVMSEDLGIGLALVLAATWIRDGGPASSSVLVADVDLLGDVAAQFGLLGPGPRPDYILTAAAPAAGMVRIGLLECKGTRTAGQVRSRLAGGCQQIAEPVNVSGVPGLVVSGLFTGAAVKYCTLEVGEGSGPRSLPADHPLVQEVQAASWVGLSMFAGNGAAEDRWIRERDSDVAGMRRRRNPRVRVRRDSPVDGSVEGIANRIALPGGTADVLFGVDADVDNALTSDAEVEILQRQSAAAQRRTAGPQAIGESRGTDGSALIISRVDD